MVQGLVAGGSSRQEVQITSWERMTQPVYTVYPLTVYMVYTVFCGFGIAGLGKLLRIIWFIRFFTVFLRVFAVLWLRGWNPDAGRPKTTKKRLNRIINHINR